MIAPLKPGMPAKPGKNKGNISDVITPGKNKTPQPQTTKANDHTQAAKNKMGKKTSKVNNRVSQLVNAQIKEGMSSLNRDKKEAKQEASKARNQNRNNLEMAQGDLDHIYDTTGGYIANMGLQINANNQQAQNQTAQAQQAFISQLQANSAGVAGGVNDELSRLGITGDTSQLQAGAAQQLAAAQQTGVNNQANLAASASNANDVTALLGGMVQGSRASNQGQALNAFTTQKQSIYDDEQDALSKVADAISDLKGKRGDLTVQMMTQLAGSPWGKFLSAKAGGKKKTHHSSSKSSSGGFSGSSSYHSSSSGSSSSSSSSGSSGGSSSSGGGGSDLATLLLHALNGKK